MKRLGGSAATIAALAAGLGLYHWMLVPSGWSESRGEGDGLSAAIGLGASFAYALASALLVHFFLGFTPAAPRWRGALAIAASGLYLAALRPALGTAALVLAPLVAAGVFLRLIAGRLEARADGGVLALHAGALLMGLALVSRWEVYRRGLRPLLDAAGALVQTWLG